MIKNILFLFFLIILKKTLMKVKQIHRKSKEHID